MQNSTKTLMNRKVYLYIFIHLIKYKIKCIHKNKIAILKELKKTK